MSSSLPEANEAKNNENNTIQGETSNMPSQPTIKPQNFHALLLNRNKKPLGAMNMGQSKVPSTPSNVKRLQVDKWFNSPTDNMFSPCSKKLYKKNYQIQGCSLAQEIEASDDTEEQEPQAMED